MNWELLEKIDFSMVFAQERSSFRKLHRLESQKRYLADVCKQCIKLDINLSVNTVSPALIFYKSMDRPDYDLLLKKVTELGDYPVVSLSQKSRKLNYDLIKFIKDNYRYARIIEEENLYLQQALKLKLLAYFYFFKRVVFSTKKAVFFSDMQGPENFFCQAFNLLRIPTSTLQHGLYVEYFDKTNINIINYKHHVADYFLAWGDCTANLIHKYRPDSKVVVVGKPTLTPAPSSNSTENPGCILIVTDQSIFDKQNIEMISIVLSATRRINPENVVVKLHPSNEKLKYTDKFKNLKIVEDIPKNINLVVGHTTSLLYEMLSQGYNVLRYRTEVESIHFPPAAEFDSVNRFKNAREWISSNKANKGSGYYIKYLGKESLEHYQKFLDYFNT